MFELKTYPDIPVPEFCQNLVRFAITERNSQALYVAKFILHLCRGSEYDFQINDLGYVGQENFADALSLIRMTIYLRVAPDNFYQNQSDLIEYLASEHQIKPKSCTETHD